MDVTAHFAPLGFKLRVLRDSVMNYGRYSGQIAVNQTGSGLPRTGIPVKSPPGPKKVWLSIIVRAKNFTAFGTEYVFPRGAHPLLEGGTVETG